MSQRPRAESLVHIEESHVRVTEYRFAPGAETGWHRHAADYVVVPLADGELLLEEPGGASRVAALKRHVPYARREGVEHNVVNASPEPYAFIEVEMFGGDEHGSKRTAMLERFVAAWNAHDTVGLMDCFADDCVFWSSAGPHPEGGIFEGRDAVAVASAAIFEMFPDATWTDNRTTIFGDRALWEWTFVGTGKGGSPTRVRGLDVLELVGDRIRRKNSFRKTVTAA